MKKIVSCVFCCFFDAMMARLCYFCREMEMKRFFGMSRNERRGTIVVLALIALVLAAIVAVRGWQPSPPAPGQVVEQEQFDAETDSVLNPALMPAKNDSARKKPKHHRSARKHSAKKHASPPPPAPVNPVPRF